MTCIDIQGAIRQHTQWRRQFLNAFAGGEYIDMPLSEHRSCTLDKTLAALVPPTVDLQALNRAHLAFHSLANEIVDLSNNGQAHAADLLLPELTEASHHLVQELDRLRERLAR
jgi:hypothetical protein